MKTLYVNPVNGIAGDMFAAALVDLGVDQEELTRQLRSLQLPIDSWTVQYETAMRGSLQCRRFIVDCTGEDGHGHGRHLSQIVDLINASDMSDDAKDSARDAFETLAKVEAEIHGTSPEKIHFHEVGAVDSIIDVCACCICLDLLGVDDVQSSPPALGGGTVTCDHGVLPVPVPAVCKLLDGSPVTMGPIDSELTTPTGAVLLKTFVGSFAERPVGRLVATGYGGGTKEFDTHPNVLQVMLFETAESAPADDVIVIESNVDDMPAEFLTHLGPELLEQGALDYCVIPCTMKKGRSGIILQVICRPEQAEELSRLILWETTSFGVRRYPCSRLVLDRESVIVTTDFGDLQVKLGRDPETGDLVQVSPEFEACREVATATATPLKIVYDAARFAAMSDFS
jgi:uncharacterized protein (TIGR00299 family) protein